MIWIQIAFRYRGTGCQGCGFIWESSLRVEGDAETLEEWERFNDEENFWSPQIVHCLNMIIRVGVLLCSWRWIQIVKHPQGTRVVLHVLLEYRSSFSYEHVLVFWLSWTHDDLVLNIISCLRKRHVTSNLRQTFLLMRFPLFPRAKSFMELVYKTNKPRGLIW